MIFTNLFNWVRTAKLVAIALVCGVMLVVNTAPAFAFGMKGSAEPTQGTAQLDGIYEKSEQVAKGQPRGMEEITNEASKGLNAVQGAADTSKMKSPGDSKGAKTVEGDIKDVIESAVD